MGHDPSPQLAKPHPTHPRLLLTLTLALIPFTHSPTAFAESVGGTFDPWLADQSPQALASRAAEHIADMQNNQLEPLPPGITIIEQRKTVIDAYERAIAVMPGAPSVPNMLLRIGYLWNNCPDAPPDHKKALDAYNRLLRDFPSPAHSVLEALLGQAGTYYALQDMQKSRAAFLKIRAYPLPSTATPYLQKQMADAKSQAEKWITIIDRDTPPQPTTNPTVPTN